MRIRNLNTIFFFLIFLAAGTLAFFVVRPFLTAVLVAAVLATIFFPWYRFFLRTFSGHRGLSSALVLFLAALLVILPVVFITVLVLGEATDMIAGVSRGNYSFSNVAALTQSWISKIPVIGSSLVEQGLGWRSMLESVFGNSGTVLSFLETIYGGAASFVFWIFSLFFTFFYFLVDGERIARFLKQVSPLSDGEDEELMRDFVSMSRAIMKGSLAVAAVQGILGGIGFAAVGLSSPAMWGAVMGIFSLIPIIGTGIIWVPAGLGLLLVGDVWQGAFLLAFGAGVISTVDNILRPKLVGRDTQIHPLLVFFSTIGGISLFGIPGFLIGPIIVSFFLALVRIYGREFRHDLDAYNRTEESH